VRGDETRRDARLRFASTDAGGARRPCAGCLPGPHAAVLRVGRSFGLVQGFIELRLSATVTSKFFPLYHFFPIFSLYFFIPAAVSPKYSPIAHYNYKISFSISTINFLSTNNYSWTHSTVFRVMNSDTLDLGEREKGADA
jgi:hypothetical protein